MTSSQIKKIKLPDSPGVYFFLGKNRQILYVGKATSLRDRVRSYFHGDIQSARGPRIALMLPKIKSIDFKKTDSVLEAMILEADLIKKFKPEYNVANKDDKSYNCVVITDEEFPRVLLVRKKDLNAGLPYKTRSVFGPFPEGLKLRVALKIIRRIFPFSDKCSPTANKKPCFNRQIGLCPGVCTGEISKTDYANIIKNIERLFKNKKNEALSAMKKEMDKYAKEHEFEKAALLRNKISALKNIRDVALVTSEKISASEKPLRVEAYDIAHTTGQEIVGVMTVVTDGLPNKNEYRKFIIRSVLKSNDTASLGEMLQRRLRHEEWALPDIIVVDGGLAQKNAAEKVISSAFLNAEDIIPVVAVTKDEHHRPKALLGEKELIATQESAILLANAEAHRFAIKFHRERRGKTFKPVD